jgi:recA bacterial DNA recombination protein
MQTDAIATSPSLETALETLRARGLGLRRASEAPEPERARPSIPTGHAALDAALGNGWPRGALAGLDAIPGSGATTLTLGTVAAAQAAGGLAAWIDLSGTFDPSVAAGLAVDLGWLLVVRPADVGEAIELAGWLARGGLIDIFALDLGGAVAPRPALDRLATLMARGSSVGLIIGGTQATASIRVALERQAWLAVGRDLVGQRVTATVTRHRWGMVGAGAELDLWFGEGRHIDPLLVAAAEPRPVVEARPALQVIGA